jgi:hypothetical protein
MAAFMHVDDLPAPPDVVDWGKKVSEWGVMKNDILGNCTSCGIGHSFQTFTSNAGQLWTPTDQQVVEFYEKSTGYNPNDPNSDQGGVETDVLTYLARNGFYGHSIGGFVSITPSNIMHVKQATYLFGGLYVGVSLPTSAQDQKVWEVVDPSLQGDSAPNSWGGHCVWVIGYNDTGPVCITWGQIQQMSWSWWRSYGDEAFAIISTAWICSNRLTPTGISYEKLYNAMSEVRNG